MKIDREGFLVLVAAIAACHEGRDVTQVTVPMATPSSSASVDDADCNTIANSNAHLLSNPSGECETSTKDEIAVVRSRLLEAARGSFFAKCRHGHGTWAVLVRDAELSEPDGESGAHCGATVSYSLVFVDDSGKRVFAKDREWQKFNDSELKQDIATTFDFDGDGRDELVLTKYEWENGDGSSNGIEVLQPTAGGAIVPYPIGFDVTDTVDADGDGRPDFVDGAYFNTIPPCYGLAPVETDGVPLLIHSLPNGTFSNSDATSRRWARTKCVTAPGPAPSDDPIVASCKRLWGQSVPTITKGLSSTSDYCNEPLSSPKDVTAALVKRDPPFTTLDHDTPDPLPTRLPK